MKENIPIDFGGRTNLSSEEILLMQSLKKATEHFEQIIGQRDLNSSGEICPKGIRYGWSDNSVNLTTDNPDISISVRKTDNGFVVNGAEANQENVTQVIDRQLEAIVEGGL